MSPTRKAAVGVLGLWAVLLAASHWARWQRESGAALADGLAVEVSAIDGDEVGSERVTVVYRRWGEDGGEALPLVLLHGSPSNGRDFHNLAPYLARDRLVIAPHLPGFGASTRDVPDYSLRAHAHYVVELLDELGIERCHVLGFSMGGGVALEMTDLARGRVASVVLLSSIGVQEMELLGSYSLNHMIHGLQLLGLWGAMELVPHFGRWDEGMLSLEYARNFYDTDQRPLRRRLLDLEEPALIVHGREDFLVPPQAAVEHHRLMAHSELQMLDDSHFLPFGPRPDLPDRLLDFLERVESGEAKTRAGAAPERVVRAALPFDPADAPRWMGPAILVMFLLLALATFVSEDLTCIGAGLLVAQGRLTLTTAIVACFVGIFVGDLLLYAAGRYLGRPVLSLPPFRWWVKEKAFEESAEWFRRRGAVVIGLGRFVPGTRLPTYLAAGILKVGAVRCAFHFFVAAAVWTPLLVGLALLTGSTALNRVQGFQRQSLVLLLVLVALLWTLRGLIVPLFSWKGRRRLLGFWRRWSRWEYWPAWLLYPPLFVYLVFLGLRHRGLTVFTAANPGMPAGGILGESKADILVGLAGAGEAVPPWSRLPDGDPESRLEAVRRFRGEHDLEYPLILKPDIGQRGSEVALVHSDKEALEHLRDHAGRFLVQRYVGGPELSVFYYRHPAQKRGRIFSITDKEFPVVVGDGKRTLEELVLADRRAVALSSVYLAELGDRAAEVPTAGERVQLNEIGAHSRGTIFRDGWARFSEALEARVDEISRTYEGFFFGRYDFRAPSIEDFMAGRELRVIELNGVTSDSTDIYDPENGYFKAYRKLFRQWKLAFEIGAANRDRGAEVTSLWGLLRIVIENRKYLP